MYRNDILLRKEWFRYNIHPFCQFLHKILVLFWTLFTNRFREFRTKSSDETSLDKSQEGGKQKENNKKSVLLSEKSRKNYFFVRFDISSNKMSLTQKALLTICQGGTVNTPVLQVIQVFCLKSFFWPAFQSLFLQFLQALNFDFGQIWALKRCKY